MFWLLDWKFDCYCCYKDQLLRQQEKLEYGPSFRCINDIYFLGLRKYMHKYLGVKGCNVCNLLLNGSAKITTIIIC